MVSVGSGDKLSEWLETSKWNARKQLMEQMARSRSNIPAERFGIGACEPVGLGKVAGPRIPVEEGSRDYRDPPSRKGLVRAWPTACSARPRSISAGADALRGLWARFSPRHGISAVARQ